MVSSSQGGKGKSTLPCYGGKKVPASMAGLAIGPMSRAMDMGDVHETEAFHTSEYTLPALLAATGLKDKIPRKEFITAFIIGQDVLIRIGVASKFASRMFHGTCSRWSFHICEPFTNRFGTVVGTRLEPNGSLSNSPFWGGAGHYQI